MSEEEGDLLWEGGRGLWAIVGVVFGLSVKSITAVGL
jgi:hypothetical protein